MQVNYIPIKGLGVSCKFLDFLLPWKRTRCSVFWCYGTVLVRFWYGVVTPVSVWVCVHILHEILEDSIFLKWYDTPFTPLGLGRSGVCCYTPFAPLVLKKSRFGDRSNNVRLRA